MILVSRFVISCSQAFYSCCWSPLPALAMQWRDAMVMEKQATTFVRATLDTNHLMRTMIPTSMCYLCLAGYGGVHNQRPADESPADVSEPRMDESPDDVLDAVTRNHSDDDGGWPPAWTRPVVIGGVLWYSTLFFS